MGFPISRAPRSDTICTRVSRISLSSSYSSSTKTPWTSTSLPSKLSFASSARSVRTRIRSIFFPPLYPCPKSRMYSGPYSIFQMPDTKLQRFLRLESANLLIAAGHSKAIVIHLTWSISTINDPFLFIPWRITPLIRHGSVSL